MTQSNLSLNQQLALALDYKSKGELAKAVVILEALISLRPENFNLNFQLGLLKCELGKVNDALVYLGNALLVKHVESKDYITIASVLSGHAKHEEALLHVNKALKINKNNEDSWACLGSIYLLKGSLDLAKMALETAILLNPNKAKHWSLLGSLFTLNGKFSEAINCQTKAISLDSSDHSSYLARAIAFQGGHFVKEALADLDYLIKLDGLNHAAKSNRLFILNYFDNVSNEALFKEHVEYAAMLEACLGKFKTESKPSPIKKRGSKIRLAFISPDFRRHSVAYFIEPILKYLDRSIFEIILYYDYNIIDDVTLRLKGYAEIFRHVAGIDSHKLKDVILSDCIDVLVDLAGHTGMNRMDLFFLRASPIQVAYLGYPNTTGVRNMDYRFTDEFVDPTGVSDHFYTEKLVRFSQCAWSYLPDKSLSTLSTKRQSRDEWITFGSFNSISKLNTATLKLWTDVLAKVNNSKLVLKCSSLIKTSLRVKLHELGMPLDRVLFLESTATHLEHLSLYSLVDIALDSFPYNGTTTTLEAISMGVPVITLAGDRHASRVGLSLLQSLGLSDCIAYSPLEYVSICEKYAHDVELRGKLRTSLRETLLDSIICSGSKQAEYFGKAITTLVKNEKC